MGPLARGLLIVVGLGSMGTMVFAWLLNAHAGLLDALGLGVTIAVGWLALSTGLFAGIAAKKRVAIQSIVGLSLIAGCGAAGPGVSAAYHRALEARAFDALEDPALDLEAWAKGYEEAVDPAFQREGWRRAGIGLRVDQAIASGNATTVQQVIAEIDRIRGAGAGAARAKAVAFLSRDRSAATGADAAAQ